MRRAAKLFLANELGATAIEYALIGSLISIAIIGALSIINQDLVRIFDYIGDNLSPALSGDGD